MFALLKINLCILFLTFANHGNANTTCEDSQKHFANLCFSPTPTKNLDLQWFQNSQPADGWHVEMGNDVARLHYAETFRGERLNASDNFENMCLRTKIVPKTVNDTVIFEGNNYGHGNLTTRWDCNLSKDFPGVFNCDIMNTGLSKYQEYIHVYISLTDNKNYQVAIICYPNGTAGWVVYSITKSLTDSENKEVEDHVTSLGFSSDDTVVLYDQAACSNDT